MRTPRRNVLLLVATLSAGACSTHFDKDTAAGRYRLEYEGQSEDLTLFANGTYVHRWREYGEQSERGTWRLDSSEDEPGCSRVLLDDFSTFSLHHRTSWYTCLTRAIDGTVVIVVNEDLGIRFERLSDRR